MIQSETQQLPESVPVTAVPRVCMLHETGLKDTLALPATQ